MRFSKLPKNSLRVCFVLAAFGIGNAVHAQQSSQPIIQTQASQATLSQPVVLRAQASF